MPKFKQRSTKSVDWDHTPRVAGRIVTIGLFTGTDLQENLSEEERKKLIETDDQAEPRFRPYMTVDTGRSILRVFESAGLSDAFACAVVGDGVILNYLGRVTLKKSNRVMRDFETSVFDWPALGYDDPIFKVPEVSPSSEAYIAPPSPR